MTIPWTCLMGCISKYQLTYFVSHIRDWFIHMFQTKGGSSHDG